MPEAQNYTIGKCLFNHWMNKFIYLLFNLYSTTPTKLVNITARKKSRYW